MAFDTAYDPEVVRWARDAANTVGKSLEDTINATHTSEALSLRCQLFDQLAETYLESHCAEALHDGDRDLYAMMSDIIDEWRPQMKFAGDQALKGAAAWARP